MPEREERDHDLRGQVKRLAKLINDQVKRNARLEKQFAEFEKESGAKGIISAIEKVETAIRESKGDMTAREEKEVSTALEDLNKTAGEKPQDPVPA